MEILWWVIEDYSNYSNHVDAVEFSEVADVVNLVDGPFYALRIIQYSGIQSEAQSLCKSNIMAACHIIYHQLQILIDTLLQLGLPGEFVSSLVFSAIIYKAMLFCLYNICYYISDTELLDMFYFTQALSMNYHHLDVCFF